MTFLDGVAVVLLAAGEGRRMGGPKSLLLVNSPDATEDEPLVFAHARALRALSLETLAVVSAPVAALLTPLLRDEYSLTLLETQEPAELGPAGSIVMARDALPPHVDTVALCPVDTHPRAHGVIALLVSELAARQALASTPIYEGRGGHPIVVRRSALDPLLRPGGPTSLRDLLTSLGAARCRVRVCEPLVLSDFDSAAEFSAHFGRPPSFAKPC